MKKCLVSIIVPVYNTIHYLEECLHSLQNQTLSNIEIICIEDCSTDGSIEVLHKLAAADERIVIAQNHTNQGLSCSRNRGMQMAHGKYLMFVDSDDMLSVDAVMSLYEYAEKLDVNGVLFNMSVFQDNELDCVPLLAQNMSRENDYEEKIFLQHELLIEFSKHKQWKMEACRYFWNREALLSTGISFYPNLLHEDNLFSFYAWMEIDKIAYLDKKLYFYRKHDNSITSTIRYKRVESYYIVIQEILFYWKKNQFDDTTNEAIYSYLEYIFWGFQQKKKYFKKYEPLSIGHPADAFMFSKLWNQNTTPFRFACLNENKLQQLKKAKKVIIYGAGNVGSETIELLTQNKIKISAIAVTTTNNNASSIQGYKIKCISELTKWNKEAVVLIAAVERHHKSILSELQRYGFEKVITLDAPNSQKDTPLK